MPHSSAVTYFRNFVFGVEDSLVSTVGLLSGIAIAGVSGRDIFITGVVLIFVEAVSMAAGSFLSESSAEEYATQQETVSSHSILASAVMFTSYFVSGFVPLFPYLVFPVSAAFPASIGCSLAALFLLGLVSARLSRIHYLMQAVRMVLIGGLAIGVGVAVGTLVA